MQNSLSILSNSFYSEFFVTNLKFFNNIDKNINIQHFNAYFYNNEVKQRNYKIHLNFSFDAIIFKINRARIEIIECKISKFCLK